MILLWGHQRLFCGIIRGTPAWNDPEFDTQRFLLINLCQNCTYLVTKLCICLINVMLGHVLYRSVCWDITLIRGSRASKVQALLLHNFEFEFQFCHLLTMNLRPGN